jgi:predicted transcriptional regulator
LLKIKNILRTNIDTISRGGMIVKRSKHEIISQILDICKNGASKTRIVYQANLNFRTVNPYIDLLIKNELIKKREGQNILYETTERGINLLDNFREMNRHLDIT